MIRLIKEWVETGWNTISSLLVCIYQIVKLVVEEGCYLLCSAVFLGFSYTDYNMNDLTAGFFIVCCLFFHEVSTALTKNNS